MKTLMLLLALAATLPAQTNSITIKDKSGSPQTNIPIQIGRPFLDSEIPNSPQAVCDGVPLPTQADVKKRYPSGAVQFAIIAFILPSLSASGQVSCVFTDQAAGLATPLTKTDMLSAGYDFDAVMELTADNCAGCSQATQSFSARAVLESWDGVSDSETGPIWKWTSGSIAQTVIIADHAAGSHDLGWAQSNARPLAAQLSITPNVTNYSRITVDTTTGIPIPSVIRVSNVSNHDETSTPQAEDIRVCSATATELHVCSVSGVTVAGSTVTVTTPEPHSIRNGQRISIDEVRDSDGNLWNGVNGYWTITVTSPTTFTFTSANVVASTYGSGGVYGRGWNDSTVMGCAAYSNDINGNPAGCYVYPNQWSDPPDSTYKSFRPIVHATFWPAIQKVRVRFIGEAADSEKWGDLVYHLVLKTGVASPATRYASSAERGEQIFHRAGSRWTKEFWLGGAPPDLEIDHNLEYLKATRWSWNFDTDTVRNPSLVVPSIAIDEHYQLWNSRLHDIYDFANLEKSQGSPSSDDQDGPIPAWSTVYLRTMDYRLFRSVIGHAELGASWYIHFREGATGKRITRPDSAGCAWACNASGQGRVLSVTDRPNHFARNVKLQGNSIPPASRIKIAGGATASATTKGGFRLGMIHLFEPFSVPYMLTGDFFFLEELWFWAGYGAAYSYAANDTLPWARGPLNLEYGVSGVPASNCLKTSSTLASEIASSTQLIPLTSKWTGPSFPTYVNMVQPAQAGTAISIVSNNAADQQTVYLEGTSSSGQVIAETIQLDGATPVLTVLNNWVSLQGFRFPDGLPTGVVTVRFAGGGILGTYPGPQIPSSFLNHPLGDGILLSSSDARDVPFRVRIYGTRAGQAGLVTETVELNGVNAVPSAFSDWSRLYAIQTFRTSDGKPSLTYGTVSARRYSDNYVMLTQGSAPPGPFPAVIESGSVNEERVRVLNVDVASRLAVVERGIAGPPRIHPSGSSFLHEVTDTNNWEIRITGWYLRLLAAAAYMSPDGSAEGSYFTSIARDQIASLEGQRDLPASATDPSYTAIWNWSRTVQRNVSTDGSARCGGVELFSPLQIYDRGGPAFTQGWPIQDQALIYGIDKSLALESTGGFPVNYVAMGLGRVEELGVAPATRILNWMALFYNGLVAARSTEGCLSCPFTALSSGRYPVTRKSDGGHVTSFTEFHGLYDDGALSGINWQGMSAFPKTNAYPCISGMATAFFADKSGGEAAESWLASNLRNNVTWYARPAAGAGNSCNIRNSIVPRAISPGPITIATNVLPPAVRGQPYSFTLWAIGGTPAYNWVISSGSCPGLSLSSATGLLSGTPLEGGSCSFTITVTGATGSAVKDFVINVSEPTSSLLNARTAVVSRGAVIGYGYRGLSAQTGCSLQVSRLGSILFSEENSSGMAWRFTAASGLHPGSLHTLGLLCGSETLTGPSTDLSTPDEVAGATDMTFSAKAPPRLPDAALITVAYGLGPDNLSQSVTMPCAGSCVVTVPALNRDSIYYIRWTWKTSGGVSLASSSVLPVAVR